MALFAMLAGTASADGDLLTRINANSTINIGIEGTWPPMSYRDSMGVLVGFDVELARMIASELKVRSNFVEREWSRLLRGLHDERYDMVVNGVSITDERRESYDFSIPYANFRSALIVREDNDTITSYEDLKGLRTANAAGSAYALTAERFGSEIIHSRTFNEAIDTVLTGRADATINAEVALSNYMYSHPDARLKVVQLSPEVTPIAIAFRKDEDAATLKDAVNEAISRIVADGRLRELSIKYFGHDITAD